MSVIQRRTFFGGLGGVPILVLFHFEFHYFIVFRKRFLKKGFLNPFLFKYSVFRAREGGGGSLLVILHWLAVKQKL